MSGGALVPGDLSPSGCAVPVFQLLQWKHAIRLEALGLRHSSGRSCRAHAARVLGVKRGEAAARIEALLAQALAERAVRTLAERAAAR